MINALLFHLDFFFKKKKKIDAKMATVHLMSFVWIMFYIPQIFVTIFIEYKTMVFVEPNL